MSPGLPLLLALAAAPARSTQAPGPDLLEDPPLQELIHEAVGKRPELAQARAQIAAEQERVPQSTALPDPTLSLGIQNDGFRGIQIGKMETSFIAVAASQTLPWPGKRGLRGDVAELATREAETDLQRALLSVTADVRRAYLDLLLIRDQLALLARLETLWEQSEGLARTRYEAGEGAQSDLLRAQLERNRLRQKRWALQAEEQQRITVLNRLRGHPLDEPIATARALADLPDPVVPDPQQAVTNAEAASPELRKALLLGLEADRRVDLANKDRWPDVTVSAGLMPRWGNFDTMWQAGISFNLPVWTARKQSHAVAESRSRGKAARASSDAIRQLLRQRVYERLAVLRALVEANRLYRSGLLVQSEATVASTLAQYQVGRVTFASALEALAGYLADRNGFLDSVAAAQRIAIAEREISLEAPAGRADGGMAGAASTGPSVAPNPASPGPLPSVPRAAPSMPRM